jgi:hypothetical protein
MALDINGGLLGFQEKLSNTSDSKTVIRRFGRSGDLNRILVDDIFVLFRIPCLIGYIPAHDFKEWVNEFSSELGFVVGRTPVCLDIALEAFHKAGYLLQGFFHRQRIESIIVFWKDSVKGENSGKNYR